MSQDPKILLNYTASSDALQPKENKYHTLDSEEENKLFSLFVGHQTVGVKAAYNSMFFHYTALVMEWLKTFEIESADGKEVIPISNVVFASPDRAFSIDTEKGIGSLTQRTVLPAISFSRKSISKILDRGPTLRDVRKYVVPSEGDFQNFIEIRTSYHILDIPYQVDFWTRTQSELDMLTSQFLLPFLNEAWFKLTVPKIDFEEFIMMKMAGTIDDSSDLEPNTGQRIIRNTAGIVLQAYLPVNVSRIERTIKKVGFDIINPSKEPDPVTNTISPDEATVWTQFLANIESSIIYRQENPNNLWNITHNLNKLPTVVVTDYSGNILVGTVAFIDLNMITISFNTAVSGIAYLN